MRHAGVWLRSPVFAHGQFYVACSRVGSPSHLKFAIARDANMQEFESLNIVYKEVLLKEQENN